MRQSPNRRLEITVESEHGNKIVASTRWRDDQQNTAQGNYIVLTVGADQIIDMQECRTLNAAQRYAARG